ncbi:hypothetical protein H0A36_23495 [Endozoicomonas sp. SM1973]|uniref:Uncharacterized protein n=1 Tax=Spartinivicinus marinus TaxID=2994442 RepID=A0A853I835_9GAMM|nr:hypothetical protein [Spartinivicinus marinus]MCX4025057.1 hypothetical protein [Spartinivicinus marinus]NYZ68989.1 hypothetical protein [Spartinivicinus marinus]
MQYKSYLKLTLFMPVIGPVVIWLLALITQFEAAIMVFGINIIGLLFFCIPYFLAVGVTWWRMRSKTDKQAFWSVCYFPLLVVIFSLIGFTVVNFDKFSSFSKLHKLFEAFGPITLLELAFGVPWIILSLFYIHFFKKRDDQ